MILFEGWAQIRGFRVVFAAALVLSAALAASSSIADPAKIEGPTACAECHKDEMVVWKETQHYATFRDMPRDKKAREIGDKMGIKRVKAEAVCTTCHFTMQEEKGLEKAIAGISCESCHAPAKDWLKVHSEFSGKKKETETKEEAAARWKLSEENGMIRPKALYELAKNCFSCHVVPQEKLVNVGGHPAGSAFELVSWSQGEIRHNLWYSEGKNRPASQERKRMMYVVGLAVELETALRAVGTATVAETYAVQMAQRAAAARETLAAVAKALPEVPEIADIITAGHSAGLKLDNNAALSAAADKIMFAAMALVGKYDGSAFAAIDSMIPGPNKYKGKPAK